MSDRSTPRRLVDEAVDDTLARLLRGAPAPEFSAERAGRVWKRLRRTLMPRERRGVWLRWAVVGQVLLAGAAFAALGPLAPLWTSATVLERPEAERDWGDAQRKRHPRGRPQRGEALQREAAPADAAEVSAASSWVPAPVAALDAEVLAPAPDTRLTPPRRPEPMNAARPHPVSLPAAAEAVAVERAAAPLDVPSPGGDSAGPLALAPVASVQRPAVSAAEPKSQVLGLPAPGDSLPDRVPIEWCYDAVADFASSLEGVQDSTREHALYRRALCRVRQGHLAAACDDLMTYLRLFPAGRFAVEARRHLSLTQQRAQAERAQRPAPGAP